VRGREHLAAFRHRPQEFDPNAYNFGRVVFEPVVSASVLEASGEHGVACGRQSIVVGGDLDDAVSGAMDSSARDN
jgi:hypothetical protein